MQVCKRTRRPFKSGFKVNTVKGIITSPYTGYLAYIFYEDDSCVEIHRCEEIIPLTKEIT